MVRINAVIISTLSLICATFATDQEHMENDQLVAVYPSEVIQEEPGVMRNSRQCCENGPTSLACPPACPTPPACPGGIASLNIQCDAKRPWPQCPPQSYCFASNSVDIGPYFCCPVWSTAGAMWRPASPNYPYYPPMPDNWPNSVQATANWGGRDAPVANDFTGKLSSLMELVRARMARKYRKSAR